MSKREAPAEPPFAALGNGSEPSIPPADYQGRRQRLLNRLGDGLLVLPTAPHQLRNGDVHHDFRPGSDFWYLTGFAEPDSVLVAWRTNSREHRTVLFVPPKDKVRETWEGRRTGVRGAMQRHGADRAHPIGELWKRLPELLAPHARLFWTLGRDPAADQRWLAVFRQLAHQRRRHNAPAHPILADPLPVLAELRAIKDRHEIAMLQRAADITAAGHRRAMQAAAPGRREYEVQAEMEAVFRSLGSRRNGYNSIVASGPNACILHYTENDRTMRRGDLLLVDAGAEFGGYTADITRTFPVTGEFTPAQRRVYDIVLRAQKAGIRAARAGRPWNAPHRACVRELARGLKELGVLRGDLRRLLEKERYKPWYMHGTSHWLGLDVHDAGAYVVGRDEPRRLEPGMVLTVEPGLYFAPGERKTPRELRGIGVRIEDDVLVTRGAPHVLTAAAPK